MAVKLDFLPFSPIAFPPDLELLLRNPKYVLLIGGIVLALLAAWLLFAPRKGAFVARLGGLTWRRNQFCRGWLITGDTGSGKTSSGINQLAHQVFKHEPTWGGLCIDEKGVYWEILAAMARHYGREHDLIHLQIRDDDTDTQWTPPNRYNLTGNRSIPFTTYAKFVVDTATSLGQGGDKGFFKSQAQTHIAHALEMLFELNRPVTLQGAFELLSDREMLEEEMENLEGLLETPRREAVYAHFANRFLTQPDEQLGGVRETIANYLQYFLTPEVAEVFCTGESTFNFSTIDQGKIILTTMPQKFQTERRYVNTFLKLLYYNHALRRFDKSKAERAKAGDAQAQMALAQMYDKGNGVEQSDAEAFKWWLKAAEQGTPIAQHNVGVAYLSGVGVAQDKDKALRWLTKAADQGHLKAGEYAGRLRQGRGAAPPVVVRGERRTTSPAARTTRPARYGPKEEICAEVVANFVARHTYIPDHFVCVEFAAGVWYELLKKGVNAKIRVGSQNISTVYRTDHAWVMAEVSPGNWLAIEPQQGVVYPESGSFYYRGFDFAGDGPVREHNKLLKRVLDARQKYHNAVNVSNDYVARYNKGDWVAKQAILPVINQQQQNVAMRQAEMNELEQSYSVLLQRATPSQ
jgi:hypothetical protein